MPTIKDVARAAGVSTATVSYVLNNKSAFYSEQTRQQVLDAIERVGYTPNINGRNLKANQSRLLAYAWHRTPDGQPNPVLDQFTYYLAQEAEAVGYHILTFTFDPDDPLPVHRELIRSARVDAFVTASTVANDPRIKFLMENKFPFVSFGRANPDWEFPWVDTDGAYGVQLAVEHLIALGHRRIAMVAWPEDSLTGSFRLAGYQRAMRAAGLEVLSDYVIHGERSEQTGRDALRHWLTLPPEIRPTAVAAVDDIVAIGVMNEAEGWGLVVGQDLAVIGYDDMPLGQYLRPPLTTLQQPLREICHALMVMLDDVLQNRQPDPYQLLLSPTLVVRRSCGALP